MIERLNWGAGEVLPEDWTNSDVQYRGDFARLGWCAEYQSHDHGRLPNGGGSDHEGPIQQGLPWADGTFEYVVTHHSLMGLSEPDLVPALVELRRVTKPGGWLRVSVPDMTAAFHALGSGDREWFPLDAASLDEAFCRYVAQNGATRSVFTWKRLYQLLDVSGWEGPRGSSWRATWSPHPEITELDSRPNESLFMEAMNSG